MATPAQPQGNAGLSCSTAGCNSTANPVTDTIKVGAVRSRSISREEEDDIEANQREEELAAQWRASEKAEDVQRQTELSVQWQASEQVKRRLVEEELRRKEEEAAKLATQLKAEQEARAAEQAARVAEQAKWAKEEKDRESRKQAEDVEQRKRRQQRVEAFLRSHGYSNGVNDPKKTCTKKKYPIHTAAKGGDAEIIEMLLQEGANPVLKTSRGLTALQIAEKKNKNRSHTGAIQLLNGTEDR
mmetsp:Transcript_101703/g.283163  ORF Transcript_101703/g.283163 Transcript_101703/m.283163 type:complete len:243 (-) Transcript_101703:156-884(-)|eukprot:CAMPEP_0179049886 /NCGR_PEP_ID=MMETSP0796-20121207/20444_1 /TAXON_ID=73915 /ORGANISM="Pyrodinium bahamense, Strain pbaha01" /LENGTH=242 /DNA_ID=CAMNT_0020746377 /DNA_START=28 /DNA_END=756 /DNA_ORIENTATION=-